MLRPGSRAAWSPSVSSRGYACAVERGAADPLHCPWINAKTSGDLTDAFGSSRFIQRVRIAFPDRRVSEGDRVACLRSWLAQARHGPVDHCALEFSDYAHHLKHRLPGWRRCFEALLIQEKVNTQCMLARRERQRGGLEAPAEPVNRPCHYDVELPLGSISKESIECREPIRRRPRAVLAPS
jgi:hypothetical protein